MVPSGDTYPVISSNPIISGSQSSSAEELEGVAVAVGPRSSALVSSPELGEAAATAGEAATTGAGAAAPGGDATIASAGSLPDCSVNGFGSSLPFSGVPDPDPAPVAGIGVALLRGNVFNGFTGRLGNLRAATELSTSSSIKAISAR